MKLLGLDSSGLVASAAIVEDDTLLAEYTVNYKKTHSQTLLPMLDAIAGMTELDLDTIDAIAVAAGPGSFTGLRIGSATAKGLGLALNKPLVAVPTVDALAYNLYDVPGLICPLMDARRNQVYTGLYEFRDHKMETVAPQMAVGVEAIVEQINSLGREVIYLGDGGGGIPGTAGAADQGSVFLRASSPEPAESRGRGGAGGCLLCPRTGGNGGGAPSGIPADVPGGAGTGRKGSEKESW